MSRLRLQPHLVAPVGSLQWGHWWTYTSGEREQVGDRLKGWDYAAGLSFELQPSLDIEDVIANTGLDSADDLAISLMLDCPATSNRFVTAYSLTDYLNSDNTVLAIEAPPGEVADEVIVSAHLVLWNRRLAEDGSAARPGSRLGSSEPQRVRLEGEGSRFPTEEVSFSELGLEASVWTLRLEFDDLNAQFMASVKLLINSDHPAAELLLDGSTPEARLAQSVLRADIARQMLMHVAWDEEHASSSDAEWAEGTVGSALSAMSTMFMRLELPSALKLARSDILRFERRIQDGFDLLRGTEK